MDSLFTECQLSDCNVSAFALSSCSGRRGELEESPHITSDSFRGIRMKVGLSTHMDIEDNGP